MKKVQCDNQICGNSFFFDEQKNPNTKKVRCPKCKGITELKNTSTPQEEIDEDWIIDDTPKVSSSPNIMDEIKQPNKIEENIPAETEDFFTEKKKVSPPIAPPIKKRPILQSSRPSKKIGWLVIHDEHTATYTFELQKGINRIGRYSSSTPKDVNIAIRTADKYMSRYHCDIEVRWLHGRDAYAYQISDRKSSNGTFVNAGSRLTRSDGITLRDGDTVQIGRTKLVLKLPTSVNSSRDAESSVESTDYFKTIIQ